MSAYMIDRNHVRYLVEAALHLAGPSPFSFWNGERRVRVTRDCLAAAGDLSATAAGQMLWDENRKSIDYRYDTPESPPGPIGETFNYKHADYMIGHFKFEPVQVLCSCGCYEYQACEHPDHEGSDAWKLVQALRRAATHALPGYDDATWGAPDMGNPVHAVMVR